MPSQVLIFDLPRSGGTLLERVIGNRDKIQLMDNPHGPARGTQVEWLSTSNYREGMSAKHLEHFNKAVEKSNVEWQKGLTDTKNNNQILLVNTHPFSPVAPETILRYIALTDGKQSPPKQGENYTMIPDNILLHPDTVPILTIRDPRLSVASAYRVLKSFDLPLAGGRDSFLVTTSTIWTRVLYDYFTAHGIEPLVVDGDDLMTSEAFVRHLVQKAGLDPAKAVVSWAAVTPEEKTKIHPMQWLSQHSLYESTGLKPGRAAKNIDMQKEMDGWAAEFGEHLGIVKEMIELSRSDYEYLYERRVKM